MGNRACTFLSLTVCVSWVSFVSYLFTFSVGVTVLPKQHGLTETENLRVENSKQTLFFQQIGQSLETNISGCRKSQVVFVPILFVVINFQEARSPIVFFCVIYEGISKNMILNSGITVIEHSNPQLRFERKLPFTVEHKYLTNYFYPTIRCKKVF